MTESFPLEPGEAVHLVIRRHWIALWPRFFALLVLAGLPAGFGVELLARLGLAHGQAWRIAVAASVLWAGFWLARAALVKYRYDREIWLLTNRRLIGTAASAPFRSETTLVDLDEIQEVSAYTSGPASILFRFGDVECHTNSATGSVLLRQAPHPREVAQDVQRACHAARHEPRRIRGDTFPC